MSRSLRRRVRRLERRPPDVDTCRLAIHQYYENGTMPGAPKIARVVQQVIDAVDGMDDTFRDPDEQL